MRTTKPALLMPVLAILAVLAFPHAPAAPNPDDHDDARLWVAHDGRLLHVSASGAMLNKLGRDVRAVAADPVRGTIATFSREPFTDDARDHGSGTLTIRAGDAASVTLAGLAAAPARLAAHDGTVWLGAGDVLYRFDADGTLAQTLPLAATIRALDVGHPSGLLFAATDAGIYTFNAGGELVTALADAGARTLATTADGGLWVARAELVERLNAGGERRFTVELPAVDALADDGRGGIWALAGGRLLHLAADGTLLAELEPARDELPFVALTAAPRSRSAWVATDAELLRVDAGGRILRTVALGSAPARTFGLVLEPERALPRPIVPLKSTEEPVLEGPDALPLTDELPERPSNLPLPEIVLSETVTFSYTEGTTVLLASTEDGTGEILSDDAVRLTVVHEDDTESTLEIDFFDDETGEYVPQPPADLTDLMAPGENTVTIEVLDTRMPQSWSLPYFLVQPREVHSRVLGGENPSVFVLGGSVDLASGNYLRAETDLTTPAPGLAVSFTRTYNSLDTSRGTYGFGWSSPYDSRATRYADGSVEIEMPSGRRAFFKSDGAGGFTAEPGVFDRLSAADGGVVLTRKGSQVELRYDPSGRLSEITEPHGNRVEIEYAGSKPVRLTDPAGRRYRFQTDAGGRITEIKDPAGGKVTYQYDAHGDLTAYTDRLGGEWHYAYDHGHRLLTVTDPDGAVVVANVYGEDGRLISTTDGAGQGWSTELLDDGRSALYDGNGNLVMIATYDERFRVTELEDAFGNVTTYDYDQNDQLTRVVDALGRQTLYEYNERGNLVAVTDPTGARSEVSFTELDRPSEIVDAEGNLTAFAYDGVDVTAVDVGGVLDLAIEYDDQGNVTRLANSAGQSMEYTYDAQGNQTSVTDGQGNTSTFTYDALGRRTSATDAAGNTTFFTYDAAGRLTSTTDASGATETRTYDARGRLSSITDERGNTWRAEYDGNGKVTRRVDPEAGVTDFTYDGRGNLTQVSDPAGNVHRYEYNENNWLARIVDAEDHLTTVVHDDQGRVTTITDPEGGAWGLEYDGADRVSARVDPLGHRTGFEYDANGRKIAEIDPNGGVTHTDYDAAGQITAVTDPAGKVTAFTYNKGGDLLGRTDRNGNTTSFVYDAAARPIEIIDALGHKRLQEFSPTGKVTRVTDENGNTSELSYDGNDRLIQAVDGAGGVHGFAYDAGGNLTSTTDANGNVTHFEYDKANRVTKVIDPVEGERTLEYDKAGNLKRTVDAAGAATTFVYDGYNRPSQRTDALGGERKFAYDGNGNLTEVVDELGRKTAFVYDAANRNIAVVDALDHRTELVRDPAGNLIESTNAAGATMRFVYDALGRPTRITDALGGTTSMTYDANGNVTGTTDPRGGTTSFVYDALNRLTSKTDALGGVTSLVYDPKGNLTAVTGVNGHTTAMTYDPRGNLLARTDPLDGLSSFVYDGAGNLIEATNPNGSTTTFAYDELNRPIAVRDALGGLTSMTYDAAGNVLSRTDANGSATSYAYDKLRRLTTITGALDGVTSMTYDGAGNVLSRTDANGNAVTSVYDALNRLVERTDALGAVTSLSYDPIGRLTARTDANGHATSYAYDALNRLIGVTDALGAESVYAYDAAGNLTSFTDANGNPITGAYDLLGRKIEKTDPVGNVHAYAYDAAGNLIEQVDGNGAITSFVYDELERLIRVDRPDGTKILEYDPAGNLIAVSNQDAAWLATYDALNRLTSVTTGEGTMGYAYDPVGNVQAKTYPNGEAASYGHDALNRVVSLTDPLGNVTSYAYDPAGNRIRTEYGNGLATDYVYDAANRLVDFVTQRPSDGALIYQNSLVRDPAGNPLELVERFQHGDEPGDVRTVQHSYAYDAVDRLISEISEPDWPSGTRVAHSFTYDPVGNLLQEDVERQGPGIKDVVFADGFESGDLSGWQGRGRKPGFVSFLYAYDEANQLLSLDETTFRHDGNGNRVEAASPDGVEEYAYDSADRLTDYKRLVPQGQSGKLREDVRATYAYDGLGRRIEKKIFDQGKPKTTRYLYDAFSFNPVRESADPGHVTHLYRRGRELVSSREVHSGGAGHVWYRQPNWRQDVAVMSNHDGGSVHRYFYTAYGDVLDNNLGLEDSSNFTGPHNHYTLTGKQLDAESGLVYYGARYLKASSRQWMSRDPLQGVNFGNPRRFHGYQFNFSNATRFIDPDGLYEFEDSPDDPVFTTIQVGGSTRRVRMTAKTYVKMSLADTLSESILLEVASDIISLVRSIPESNLFNIFCNAELLVRHGSDHPINWLCLYKSPVGIELRARRERGITVTLDAGHGWNDDDLATGTPVVIGGEKTNEDDIVRNIALGTQYYLETFGIQVVMTRTGDPTGRYYVTDSERAELFVGSDYGISIHLNSGGTYARGVFTMLPEIDSSNDRADAYEYTECVDADNCVKYHLRKGDVDAANILSGNMVEIWNDHGVEAELQFDGVKPAPMLSQGGNNFDVWAEVNLNDVSEDIILLYAELGYLSNADMATLLVSPGMTAEFGFGIAESVIEIELMRIRQDLGLDTHP